MTRAPSLRWAGLLIAVLTLMGLVACQRGEPPPPPLTAADVIQRSTETAKSLETVHFVLEVQGITAPIANGLGLARAEGDLKRPSDARLNLKLMFGSNILETELRSLEGKTYIRNPLGARFEELKGTAQIGLLDPNTGIASVIPTVVNAQLQEAQVDNSVRLLPIQGQVASSGVTQLIGGTPSGGMVNVEALVRESDWQVARMKLTGPAIMGDQPDAVRVITLSAWNVPVTIPALPTPAASVLP